MGTEYYLVREDNNTLFELGKGLVNEAFDHLEEAAPLPTIIRLTDAIAISMNKHVFKGPDVDYLYAEFVAEAVLTWADGKPVRYCDEHQIYDDERDLKVTGSRYYKEEEAEV